MGRSPCCHESKLKKGPWTPEEDEKLIDYINKHGHGSWRSLPKQAGLNRCGKSCRLRWTNYLRPDIKRGKFSQEEERLIINLHSVLGNKWSRIATHLPGRTDNEIKNVWNTQIRKKLLQMGIDPNTHKPRTDLNHLLNLSQLLSNSTTSPAWNNNIFKLQQQADAATLLAQIQLLHNLLEIINISTLPITTHFSGSQNLYPLENPPTRLVPGVLNMEKNMYSLNSCYDIQIRNPLPELVSASASPETSIVNYEMESKSNPLNYSPGSPAFTLLFESWDELMDDETSGSFFDDIPNLTSLSQPPASC